MEMLAQQRAAITSPVGFALQVQQGLRPESHHLVVPAWLRLC